MRFSRWVGFVISTCIFCFALMAQQKEPTEAAPPAEKPAKSAAEAEKTPAAKEEPPVVTHHEIHVGDRILHYTATTGYMPIKSEDGSEVEAHIFFVAYTLDGATGKRPLMFSFNGGPG